MSAPPLEFIKANINGKLVDDKDPNDAWGMAMSYGDYDNDRWRFYYGSPDHARYGELGWTRIGFQNITLPQFLDNNPVLGNVFQQDLSPLFNHCGYEITEYMGNILIESYVVPIRNGFVFLHKLETTTATIFVPDTDRRLDEIIRMRNKNTEIIMNGGSPCDRSELMSMAGFTY
jgi:hypothetical protein